MGNTFVVLAWESASGVGSHFYWRGESLVKALYTLWWAKRQGWKCIKLEWRP